jgi:hypothetical protein
MAEADNTRGQEGDSSQERDDHLDPSSAQTDTELIVCDSDVEPLHHAKASGQYLPEPEPVESDSY